jgi:hypothetical protein
MGIKRSPTHPDEGLSMLHDLTRRGFLAAAAASPALSWLPWGRTVAVSLPPPAPTPRVVTALFLRSSCILADFSLKTAADAIDTVNDREYCGAPPGSLVLVGVRTERIVDFEAFRTGSLTYEFRAAKDWRGSMAGVEPGRSDFSRLSLGVDVAFSAEPVIEQSRVRGPAVTCCRPA